MEDAVRRARAGDAEAFEVLYRAHAPRVYAVCLRMSGDAVQARELLQDVFVKAWEKLSAFRGDSAFGSWVHRIAVNTVLMDRRLAARRAEDRLEDAGGDERPLPERAAGDPTQAVDLERAIAALPPMARQVLVLHDIEGFDHAEVGGLLGIAEGTSKAHLFRARRLLRKALER